VNEVGNQDKIAGGFQGEMLHGEGVDPKSFLESRGRSFSRAFRT